MYTINLLRFSRVFEFRTWVWGDNLFESEDVEGDVKEVEEPDEASVELPSSSDLDKGIGRGILS